jgi:DNA ligase (NAD+)
MESLHNSFSTEEILSFHHRVKRKIENPCYVVEPKIDGLSVSAEYRGGKFVRASTRGDGEIGEDVTDNIKAVKNLPSRIDFKGFIEVRGEVYISEKNFLKLVEEQGRLGEKLFKNPRNAAAGSLRQKDPQITQNRNLEIIIFNIQQIDSKEISLTEHKESLDYIKKLGFSVPPFYNLYSDIEDVVAEIERINKVRFELDFKTDGAVVKINDFKQREILGSTSKYPKWAEAFKYPPEERETTLLKIEVNVGRTGILTPTAILKPVLISGTTVQRATLHNEDFIKSRKIHVGSTVILKKAGEIIPEIVRVSRPNDKFEKFKMPKICPSCASPVTKISDVCTVCTNINCPAQLLRHIIHFISRDAMDIKYLGQETVKDLVESNIIRSPADLYALNTSSLKELWGMMRKRKKEDDNSDRFEKSSRKIVDELEKSKSNSLEKLIFGLGIINVGKRASILLAKKFKNMDNLICSTVSGIIEIDGIGEKIARSVADYFTVRQNVDTIEKFKHYGLNMDFLGVDGAEKFSGKTFVFTGALKNYTRTDAVNIVENLGGKVTTGVTKNTSFLVAGENSGNKLLTAQKLGVNIVSEEDFEVLLRS